MGVPLGDLRPATVAAKAELVGAIVLAPPSAIADRWARRLADPVTCLASGWMRVRQRAKAKGVELPLVISDHCDWDELCRTLVDVGAPEVWVTHGREEALIHAAEAQGRVGRALRLVGYGDEEEEDRVRDRWSRRVQGRALALLRMIAFADLLERLTLTPGRLAKVALLRRFFETEPDPDRGIGLAALTGELSFQTAKAGLIRGLAESRTDPVLFAWSYDYVGDLAETVALMWPERPTNAAPPLLAEVVAALATTPKAELPALVAGWLDASAGVGPVRDPEADHRGAAGRGLGAAGQDRAGGAQRRDASPRTTSRRCGTGCAALRRAVRLGGGAGAAARSGRRAGVPAADAGASAGGAGPGGARSRELRRGVEVGRHPGAAGLDPGRPPALFARRRRHLGRVPGDRRARWASTRCWTASCWCCGMARWRRSPTCSSG